MIDKKNATIRLPENLIALLTKGGKSINQAVIECTEYLRRIRQVSMGEIKGVFTPDEWKFLADSLNGTMIDDVFRCNVGALIAHCDDADQYDSLGQKWHVDLNALKQKISKLSGANIDAIYTRVEDFWADGSADIETWAKF